MKLFSREVVFYLSAFFIIETVIISSSQSITKLMKEKTVSLILLVKQTSIKHLYLSNGVSLVIYWISTIIAEMVPLLLMYCIIMFRYLYNLAFGFFISVEYLYKFYGISLVAFLMFFSSFLCFTYIITTISSKEQTALTIVTTNRIFRVSWSTFCCFLQVLATICS